MSVENLLSAIVGGLLTSGVVATLITVAFQRSLANLEHRLTLEREQLAEKRDADRERREASAVVVDFLSQWVHSYYVGTLNNEARWRIQSAYWAMVLRMDAKLVKKLTPVLAGREGSPDIRDVIIEARKILLELHRKDLKASDLIYWPPERLGPPGSTDPGSD
jgi:uncharacterized membrane protein YhiD involved in acid resistance